MPSFNVKQDVNIKRFTQPGTDKTLGFSWITIGDLHGNALKLLHHLQIEGIISISKEDYIKLVRLYCKKTKHLTTADITDFNQRVSNMTVNHNIKVCLLGDELADRGQNDYFTLKIIEVLRTKGLNLEVLLSNHGYHFLDAFEEFHPEEETNLESDTITSDFTRSLNNLNYILEKGLVSGTELNRLVGDYYVPILKLLDHSFSEPDNLMTIYSHAPIDLDILQKIAQYYELTYQADSIAKLAQTIESINAEFRKQVEYHEIHQIPFPREGDEQPSAEVYPVWLTIWNRDLSRLDRQNKSDHYHINFVHGHTDGDDLDQDNVFDIDSDLGKGPTNYKGFYVVHMTEEVQLDHTEKNRCTS